MILTLPDVDVRATDGVRVYLAGQDVVELAAFGIGVEDGVTA